MSLVTRSANVAGIVVTPVSLSAVRPSNMLAASGKPNETGGVTVSTVICSMKSWLMLPARSSTSSLRLCTPLASAADDAPDSPGVRTGSVRVSCVNAVNMSPAS